MKTDEIKQKYIRSKSYKTYIHSKQQWYDKIYEITEKDEKKFEVMRNFELAGLEPSELTHHGKIRLKYGKYSKNSNTDKYEILLHIHKIFPDFYEIRFLTGGIYIR